MKQKKYKYLVILVIVIAICSNNIYATDWWSKAGDFFDVTNAPTSSSFAPLAGIKTLIEGIGNLIFFAVTVILGVKYIWGGAEAKASIKDSLLTLIIAATAFYGWDLIQNMFEASNIIGSDAQSTAQNVYNIVIYIANFAAIAGIVYVGVRYLMAGASGRADLKTKSVPIMLGIIMVYCTLGFLNLATSLIK